MLRGAVGVPLPDGAPRAVDRAPEAPPIPGDPPVQPPRQAPGSREREDEVRTSAGRELAEDFLYRPGPLDAGAVGKEELKRALERLLREAAEACPRCRFLIWEKLDPPGGISPPDPLHRSPAEFTLPVVDE